MKILFVVIKNIKSLKDALGKDFINEWKAIQTL